MSSAEQTLHRSYLYAPGSDPRIMRKALAAGADAVILDLEDAVAPDAKDEARAAVRELLDEVTQQPSPPEVHVRINREGDGYRRADLDDVVGPGLAAVRLPKAESTEAIGAVATVLTDLERSRGLSPGGLRLYPTIESAQGATMMGALARSCSRIARMAFGAADLLADLGARGDDELATLHVRSELVLRSRAAGIGPPIDSVHTDLDDQMGLRLAAQRARALGFYGKSVIHPRQLKTVHEVFTPTDAEVAWAQRVVTALEDAGANHRGAVEVDGRFVDAAIAARARAVLALRRN